MKIVFIDFCCSRREKMELEPSFCVRQAVGSLIKEPREMKLVTNCCQCRARGNVASRFKLVPGGKAKPAGKYPTSWIKCETSSGYHLLTLKHNLGSLSVWFFHNCLRMLMTTVDEENQIVHSQSPFTKKWEHKRKLYKWAKVIQRHCFSVNRFLRGWYFWILFSDSSLRGSRIKCDVIPAVNVVNLYELLRICDTFGGARHPKRKQPHPHLVACPFITGVCCAHVWPLSGMQVAN